MEIVAVGKSDVGKNRKNNEDSFLVDHALGLYAVADGIGGHEGGEVASRLATGELVRFVREKMNSAGCSSSEEIDCSRALLNDAFLSANRLIIQTAAENPALRSMGTTLTALFFCGRNALLSHIGDSRAYRLKDGVLSQISEDHSIVAEQLRAGLITSDQARISSYRHIITKALGIDSELAVDHRTIEAGPGDRFLLCSDGLTEMVEDNAIRSMLMSTTAREAADLLIDEANNRGGADNITVVVVQIAGD